MNYKIFGKKTGLRVSELALGTGSFGTRWGYGAKPDEARKIFDQYVDAGGNFIDTADAYQNGESEELLGEFIGAKRNDLVLASKYTLGGTTLQTTGNSRKNMKLAVEASLKRLKTDYLDIYWAHLSDGQTPIEVIVRGFDDLVREGKILYAGFSNFPAWRIANASLMADIRGWSPIAAIQIEYNLIERGADRELLPMAEALGLAAAFWSPLAGGSLTGKYRSGEIDKGSRKEAWSGFLLKEESSKRETAIIDLVATIAKELNVPLLQVALAWLRQKDTHTTLSTITILGPRNAEQLQSNLDSLQVFLSDDQLQRLSAISSIDLGSPHNIIAASGQRIYAAGSGEVQLKHSVA